MKRKLLTALMAVLLLLTVATPAFADVIWEPDNTFHRLHRDECTYHNRSYLVNGEKGYVTVLTAPNGAGQIANVANGTCFFAEYLWTDTDGTQWAIGYPAGDYGNEGWICMSDLMLIYDHICFVEDHGHEFEEYDGSDLHLVKACGYSYPGGMLSAVLTGSEDYPIEGFQYLYTDEDGRRWSYVGYYNGSRNIWICLDDPTNSDLGLGTHYVDRFPTAAEIRGENVTLVDPADTVPNAMPMWMIPVVLIAAVAVVTAVILRRRRKKTA